MLLSALYFSKYTEKDKDQKHRKDLVPNKNKFYAGTGIQQSYRRYFKNYLFSYQVFHFQSLT